MKIKALKEVCYAGKTYHAGQTFDASEDDANTLVVIGTAKYSEPEKPQAKPVVTEKQSPQKYETKVMTAKKA